MTFSELRVHGVSGTPPKEMLYTDPVTYDRTNSQTKVFEPNRDTWDVRGFHWGSLTAGRSITALWILLAPFAMANASGWMTDHANRWTRAFGRVAGFGLTAIFFAQISNMALDTPFIAKHGDWANDNLSMLGLFLLACLVGIVLAYVSTQSTFKRLTIVQRLLLAYSPFTKHMTPTKYWDNTVPDGQWTDPAAGARLTGDSMWSQQAVLHRLRRLHVAGGLTVIALTASTGIGDETLTWVAGLLVLLVVVLLLLTTWAPAWPLTRWLTAVLPLVALGTIAWTAIALTGASLGDDSFRTSASIVFAASLVFGAGAALALLGEWAMAISNVGWRFYRYGWAPLGILAIGALIGASLGLTGTLLLEDLLAPDTASVVISEGAGWTAIAMLGLVIVVLVTFVGLMLLPLKGTDTLPGSEPPTKESTLRRTVLRARILLGIAGAYGIAAGVTAVIGACESFTDCDPVRLAPGLSEPTGWTVDLLGFSFDLGTPVGVAKLLVVVVPAVLIFRSIVGGLLSGEDSRRKVGILWDLGSFWPRWFHPLGPPAYSPYAVTRLEETLREKNTQVLAAHSQGSLISAVALHHIPQNAVPLAFLTYGSQLGILYRRLFPSVGFEGLTVEIRAKLGNRWVNLWRRSDPIGGQPIPELGIANWHLMTGFGHSQYELAPEYCAARQAGLSGNLEPPAYPDLLDCWERG